jgi:YD repeat-containing protein
VTSSQDALGLWSCVQNDVAGNAVQRTDQRGWVSTFGYDNLNRLESACYHDGSLVTYAYDRVGRLASVFSGRPKLTNHLRRGYNKNHSLYFNSVLRGGEDSASSCNGP